MIQEMLYKSTIKSSNKFVCCISIPVRKLIYSCKNVRCYILSTPWITDDLGSFVFNFSCWTTVEYYSEVRNAKKWTARMYHDVSNKTLLIFIELLSCWCIKYIEHYQVKNILESLIDIVKPFHDSLLFCFNLHLCS